MRSNGRILLAVSVDFRILGKYEQDVIDEFEENIFIIILSSG